MLTSAQKTFDPGQFLRISLPLSVQFLLRNCVTMTDSFMVGFLGNHYLAALKIGSDYVRFLIVLIMAITTAGTILASRYWGAGNRDGFARIYGITIALCAACASAMALALHIGGERISRMMIGDPSVFALSGAYLRVYAPAMFFTAVNMAIAVGFISRGKTMQSFVQQAITSVVNVVLNYLLVFGHAGFPRMEVQGAAWASVAAEGCGTLTLIVLATREDLFAGILRFSRKSLHEIREIGTVGWPLFVNMAVWQGSMLVYLKIIGTFGATATAAWGVSSLFTGVLFIFVVGFRISASVTVGHLLGGSEPESAYEYARKAVRYTLWISLIPVAALLALSPVIPSWFRFTAQGYTLMVICLVLTGAKQLINTMSSMLSHIIIAGKDSRAVLVITLVSLFLVGIPFSYLVGIVWKIGMLAVFLVIIGEDLLKAALFLGRFRGRKWLHAGT